MVWEKDEWMNTQHPRSGYSVACSHPESSSNLPIAVHIGTREKASLPETLRRNWNFSTTVYIYGIVVFLFGAGTYLHIYSSSFSVDLLQVGATRHSDKNGTHA